MKEYIVINYINNLLTYDFRKITKEEKKYVNKMSFNKDSLCYTLKYFKRNIKKISTLIKEKELNIELVQVKKTISFKYLKEFIESLNITKLNLSFEYSLKIEDYNILLDINNLKEIYCYFMPSFIINKFETKNIKIITNYKKNISDKFMLNQDSLDYDTLYYRKKLNITNKYDGMDNDIKEFFKINYYLKSIDIYYYDRDIFLSLVKLIKEDNTKNILILMHEYSDKGNFLKENFKWLKNLNKKCKEEFICEFRIIYSENYVKNNLFKQLTYNNLKLVCILIMYISLSCLIIYKSLNIVNVLNTQKLKFETYLPQEDNSDNKENNEENNNTEIILNNDDEVLNEKEEQIVKNSKYKLDNVMSNLTKINKETVGYLVVKNTNISYPVVQHSDNSYYLGRDFYKNKTSMGWIYLDYRNNKTKLDTNNIIYGHSMLNGTMFGTLKKVLESTYRKDSENMIISYDTLDHSYKFKIFSAYKVDYTTDYLKTNFETEKEFNKFINTITSRSIFKTNENIKYTDKILTLSTCTGSNNRRLVVHAVLMEEE